MTASEYEGKLEPTDFCRAWLPAEERYCDRTAGEGTGHPGSGRCVAHKGPGDDPTPLDLHDDLASLRAVRDRFLEVREEITGGDLSKLTRATTEVRRIVERIEAESAGGDEWTEERVADTLRAFGRVVGAVIRSSDLDREVAEKILDRIRSEWEKWEPT